MTTDALEYAQDLLTWALFWFAVFLIFFETAPRVIVEFRRRRR